MVAQLVEQRTENPRVVGSIPTLATIFNKLTGNHLRRPLFYKLLNPAAISAAASPARIENQPTLTSAISLSPEGMGMLLISIFPNHFFALAWQAESVEQG